MVCYNLFITDHLFYKKGVVYDWIKNIRGGGNLELTPQGFCGVENLNKKCYISDIKHHKYGFTLAEVLITLGIIGVVVAMTMPTLIARHNEKVWTTSFLRVYSTLENAYRRVQEENGTFDNWTTFTMVGDNRRSTVKAKDLYEYMIKPYVEINQAFVPKNDNWDNIGKYNCWPEKSYYFDKTPIGSSGDGTYRARAAVSLKSGECIILGYGNGDFIVDLNSKRGPNTLGKDQFIFSFDIKQKERIKPGNYEIWWTDNANYCDKSDAHGWIAGVSCGFWIVRYHNMDYLHLPFDEVKKRWRGGVW